MLKMLVGGSRTRFTTRWKTDNAGTSTSVQIRWPTSASGTYNCIVYWGDGSSSTITTYNDAAWTHTYSGAGTYTVTIVGTFTGISFAGGGDRLKLLNISSWGMFAFGAASSQPFSGCSNLTITAADRPSLAGVTALTNAFNGCSSITTIPGINSWDVSAVTMFNGVFSGCSMFNQNINDWNVSSATNMISVFSSCTVFNQNIGSWNTGNVLDMSSMFISCNAFNQNISSWNTSKVTNMSSMFFNAFAFNQPIGTWSMGLVSNVQNMLRAPAFQQNIGAWNITSITVATNFLLGVTLTNANYNALLAGWGAQVAKTGVTFSGGNSHYDSFSGGFDGTAGRAVLTGTYTWTITDGGTP